jgi:hypothetical protein
MIEVLAASGRMTSPMPSPKGLIFCAHIRGAEAPRFHPKIKYKIKNNIKSKIKS